MQASAETIEPVVGGDEDGQRRGVAERDERHVDVDVAGRRFNEQFEVITERPDGRHVEFATDVEPRPGAGVRDEQAERFGQVRQGGSQELELLWSPWLLKAPSA
ncbi:MAG TPA: hypothetical protein VK549_03805 [Acidimicrobiia bacterium]|nr:hypothetical protein [Acidimicrobiia bacterium]